MATKSRSLATMELPILPNSIVEALEGQKDTMAGILVANARRPGANKCSNCIQAELLCPGRTEAAGCILCVWAKKTCSWTRPGFVYEPLPGIQEESEREVEDHTPNMPAEERLSSTPSSTYSYESDRSSTYRENVPSAGSGRWREEDYVLVPPAQPSRSHADVSMTGSTRQTDEQSWVHIRSVDTDGQKRTLGRLVNESSASTNIGLIHPQPLVTTTSSLLAALDELQNAGNLPPTSTSHQTGSLATGSSLPTTGEWNAIFSTPPFALCENGTPAAYGPPFQPVPIAHATQTHPGTVWPPIAQNGVPASAEGNATHTYGHQTRNGALGNLNIQDRGTVSRELSRPTQRAWDNSSQGGMPNGEVREMPWIDPRYDPNSSGSWGQYNGAYAY